MKINLEEATATKRPTPTSPEALESSRGQEKIPALLSSLCVIMFRIYNRYGGLLRAIPVNQVFYAAPPEAGIVS